MYMLRPPLVGRLRGNNGRSAKLVAQQEQTKRSVRSAPLRAPSGEPFSVPARASTAPAWAAAQAAHPCRCAEQGEPSDNCNPIDDELAA